MIERIPFADGWKSGLTAIICRGRRDNAWAFNMTQAAVRDEARLGLNIVAYSDVLDEGVACEARLPIDVRWFWCEQLVPADVGQRPNPADAEPELEAAA